MLETKALPAHFLHIYVQTQIHLCIPSIKIFAFTSILCWPSVLYLHLACSEHLLSQFSANPAVTNLCRLISYECDLLKPTLGPTTSPTARSCQTCAVKEELFSSPLIFSWNHICIFFVPNSRLGGWQLHCWKFQPDPVAEARAEVDSTVAEAFYLEKLWCWRTCKQLALQGFGAFQR